MAQKISRYKQRDYCGGDISSHYNWSLGIIDTTFKEGDIFISIGAFKFETPPYIENCLLSLCFFAEENKPFFYLEDRFVMAKSACDKYNIPEMKKY